MQGYSNLEALYIWALSAAMFELFHHANFAGGAGLPTGGGAGTRDSLVSLLT